MKHVLGLSAALVLVALFIPRVAEFFTQTTAGRLLSAVALAAGAHKNLAAGLIVLVAWILLHAIWSRYFRSNNYQMDKLSDSLSMDTSARFGAGSLDVQLARNGAPASSPITFDSYPIERTLLMFPPTMHQLRELSEGGRVRSYTA